MLVQNKTVLIYLYILVTSSRFTFRKRRHQDVDKQFQHNLALLEASAAPPERDPYSDNLRGQVTALVQPGRPASGPVLYCYSELRLD